MPPDDEDIDVAPPPPWQARRGQVVRGVFRNARLRRETVDGVVTGFVDECLQIGRSVDDPRPRLIDMSRFYEIEVCSESADGRAARVEASTMAADLAKYIRSREFSPSGALERVESLRLMFSTDRSS